ncbi:TlpA disulfide reductase family protein [Halocynthiibacter styelae]|uniref:TlpA family protein disulfide reductase n=1 Tax=Halocynthiibacter styelae TaxID=2761955 RepID=A0A8J7IMW7_9RHOB|nr:TlpA disulfide reductase family protein [Paenihalocynthiibacter styelae]MBI1493651.1 TlpA family protein disulfide reductase [Paenihalocynthiibacter styelae]
MNFLKSLVLYTALAASATSAMAQDVTHQPPDREELREMREGSMRKLILHPEPKRESATVFTDPQGGEHTLADYQGKYVLLNFWATWCTPCRVEMPSLDRLQARLGGDQFAVVPVATSHNPQAAIDRFWTEAEIENLPILLDPSRALAADFGALSLPLTIILNPEGKEVARLIGDAEWDSDSAIAILAAMSGAEDKGAAE